MCRACGGRRPAGFTLLEVLVAIGVLSVSMSLVYAIYLSVFSVIDHVEQAGAGQERASVMFSRLSRDIGGLYKGVSGSFRAAAAADAIDAEPFLQFTTTSALRFDPNRTVPPMVVVGYSLYRSGNDKSYELYRLEKPFEFTPVGDASGEGETGSVLLVCEHVREFRITYTDQFGAELDSWQARSSRSGEKPGDDLFPTGLRVEMELAQGPGADAGTKRFTSFVAIRPDRLTGAPDSSKNAPKAGDS